MKTVISQWMLVLVGVTAIAHADFDWQDGAWGVVINDGGAPGSPSCPVAYPEGTKTGNALAIHYSASPTDWPQLWVFLTDGFWRQTSQQSEFLTSYRLFRYYGSNDEDCDRLAAVSFHVLGVNTLGQLELETVYDNNSQAGDRFRVSARVRLEPPTALQTSMRADLTVSNASGRAVAPHWQGHRILVEQWTLFGISSMYVADHLTGGLPAWYAALDEELRYVGIVDDYDLLNDGYSVNGGIRVSTHDTKYIVCGETTVALDHDTNSCPIISIPAYEWYEELVLHGQVSTELRTHHAYDASRNHHVELLSVAGLTDDRSDLRWAATYNRSDGNMVDGDNIQIKLGIDDFLDTWPEDAVQTLSLRLTTGNSRPRITEFTLSPTGEGTLAWTTEPGERYAVQHAPKLPGDWADIAPDLPGPTHGLIALPEGFFRVIESPNPSSPIP